MRAARECDLLPPLRVHSTVMQNVMALAEADTSSKAPVVTIPARPSAGGNQAIRRSGRRTIRQPAA
jgi:hypothetical protein